MEWEMLCWAIQFNSTLALMSHIFTLQRVEIPIIWFVSCFLDLKLNCPFWTVYSVHIHPSDQLGDLAACGGNIENFIFPLPSPPPFIGLASISVIHCFSCHAALRIQCSIFHTKCMSPLKGLSSMVYRGKK
jgi:hypothetical protein